MRGCESMLGAAVLGCYMVLRRRTVVASSCCRLLFVMQTAVDVGYLASCRSLTLSLRHFWQADTPESIPFLCRGESRTSLWAGFLPSDAYFLKNESCSRLIFRAVFHEQKMKSAVSVLTMAGPWERSAERGLKNDFFTKMSLKLESELG